MTFGTAKTQSHSQLLCLKGGLAVKLHEKVKLQAAMIEQLNINVNTVKDYVSSDKFAADNQVNTADILLRISEGERELLTLEDQL
jgi:hypothetical protein